MEREGEKGGWARRGEAGEETALWQARMGEHCEKNGTGSGDGAKGVPRVGRGTGCASPREQTKGGPGGKNPGAGRYIKISKPRMRETVVGEGRGGTVDSAK